MTIEICHANNGQAPTDVQPIPGALRNKANPTLSDMISDGWLEYVPSALPNIKSSTWIDDGQRYYQADVVQWTAEELAAQEAARKAAEEAAEAARKATPIVYDQAIEAPLFSVLSQTAKKGIGITATDEGDLVTVIVHESPWPDKATLEAKLSDSIAKHKAAKDTAKAGISGQLQTRIENLERLMGLRP